ncbi:Uncharacterized conserved protein [Ceraceosorus bombacis]|uniref:tRNA (guanine(9)-N1)-methyltransferase n=1 Tax=Ceraceosorus bombacis TaxID=401625 RepID=A0A0N7L9M6_9BASI|nr:Uncharacterized conserved protein [Ceraceosorus bombacis]
MAEAGPSNYAARQQVLPDGAVSETDVQAPTDAQAVSESDGMIGAGLNLQELQQPLSKNARKRLLKMERFEAQKAARRARDKEKKKEKQARRREESRSELRSGADVVRQRPPPKIRKPFDAAVCIDLGFDDLMTDKEITSMSSQIGFVYASNKSSASPFRRLVFSGPGPQIASHSDKSSFNESSDAAFSKMQADEESVRSIVPFAESPTGKRMTSAWKWELWKNIERVPRGGLESLIDHERDATNELSPVTAGPTKDVASERRLNKADSADLADADADASLEAEPTIKAFRAQDIIYLTADGSETLTDLEAGKMYVIGGLVDRNRHKNICLDKARALGVRAARLPIDEEHLDHRALNSRKVLTVNQVFDILLGWVETRDWASALDRGVPGRKFAEETKSQKRARLASASSSTDHERGAIMQQLSALENEHEIPAFQNASASEGLDEDELYNSSNVDR